MKPSGITRRLAAASAAILILATTAGVPAQAADQAEYKPNLYQAGKDVVWVPTPGDLVEKMLDMAKLTPADTLLDLGSGDGRTVIAAAKRGATASGIETTRTWLRCQNARRKRPAWRPRRPLSRPIFSSPT